MYCEIGKRKNFDRNRAVVDNIGRHPLHRGEKQEQASHQLVSFDIRNVTVIEWVPES
jgi:hypothetical protein